MGHHALSAVKLVEIDLHEQQLHHGAHAVLGDLPDHCNKQVADVVELAKARRKRRNTAR